MSVRRRPLQRTSTRTTSEPDDLEGNLLFGNTQTLAKDMSKIVNRRLFSDVIFLVGTERVKIYGHKCILSARNEVFRLLFTTDPQKSSFEVTTTKPVTFLLLLYFLYTNSISFDRLNFYDVFLLLKTANKYKCKELALLAEVQCGILLDNKTAFELLPEAIELDLQFLRDAALEHIEDYSSILLSPTNDDILALTPKAMKAILESNLLELDEPHIIEVACVWAERFLKRAREHCIGLERGQGRASFAATQHGQEESLQELSEASRCDATQDTKSIRSSTSYMEQALEDVTMVMGALRLTLLSPNELARLEEEQLEKRLIPREYFINAWRYMALQAAQLPSSEMPLTPRPAIPRKGTLQRTQRKKLFGDSSKRNKSWLSKLSD